MRLAAYEGSPVLWLDAAPSTTSFDERAKIAPARRSRGTQWRVAPPLRSSAGRDRDVHFRLHRRLRSAWTYVTYAHGGFWVYGDTSVIELVERLTVGGFYVESPPRSFTASKPKRNR